MKNNIILNVNTIIFGKSLSGKTKKFLLPSINDYINKRESFLIVDTTEEYIKTYFNKLSSRKYNIVLLNLRDYRHSVGWNPLLEPYKQYQSGNIQKAIIYLQNLANELFQDIEPTYEYLKDEIKQYFIALAILLFRSADVKEINLSSIYALSSMGDKKIDDTTYLGKILSFMDVMDPVYMLGSNLVYSPKNIKGEMLAIFNQRLVKFLRFPSLSNLLRDTTFDFKDIDSKPTALFINCNESEAVDNYLISSFIRQLFDVVLQNNRNNPFHLVMDNLELLPKINCLPLIMSLANYYNYSVSLGIRNSEIIAKVYGTDYRKIMLNTKRVYNLDYENNFILVDGNEKRTLSKESFEDCDLPMENYEYPLLEEEETKFFNIEKEIASRIDDIK